MNTDLLAKVYEAIYWIWPDPDPSPGTYEAVSGVIEALIEREILRETDDSH